LKGGHALRGPLPFYSLALNVLRVNESYNQKYKIKESKQMDKNHKLIVGKPATREQRLSYVEVWGNNAEKRKNPNFDKIGNIGFALIVNKNKSR